MTVRAVVENLDDVPDEWKSEYQERDGKFYLDLDDSVKVHTAVAPLARSLDAVKRERNDAKAALTAAQDKAAPEGFELGEWTRLREEEERRKKDPNYKSESAEELRRTRESYEQRLREAAQQRQRDLEEKDRLIAGERSSTMQRVKREELLSAIASVGVSPHFTDAVVALLMPRIKCERDEEGSYQTHVETDLGNISVLQYLDQWSKSAVGKPYVPEPKGGGAQGGGVPTSREPNPFSAEYWNATKQGEIIKSKGMVYAEQLASKAGTTVGGPKPPPVRRG